MKLAMILDSESGAPVLRGRVSDVSEGALWLLFRQTLPFLAPAPQPACCPPSPAFSLLLPSLCTLQPLSLGLNFSVSSGKTSPRGF